LRQVIPCLCMVLLWASCSKDEVIHENLIIEGNEAPEITGVSSVTLNNYVNSLYIDLLGRTPTADELASGADLLISNDYSVEARETLISDMMSQWEYYKNINLLTAQEYIIDVDSISIKYQISYWDYLVDLYTDMGMDLEAAYYAWENVRLLDLSTAHVELSTGAITGNTYLRRYLDNYYYDQVNMGSENFVVATFVHLFHRYPTDDEQVSGVAMVDGASEQLFLTEGSSKGDFMDIMTSTPEFYQGQVISMYTTFLARMPNSEEMDLYAQELMETHDWEAIKMYLLTGEEYAGF